MSIDDSDAALRIVEAGRQRVLDRMRDAFSHQAATHADLAELDPAMLERLVHEAAERAGASLWRISLAEGAADEFGIQVSDALGHPAVSAAEQLVGAPEEPEPMPGPEPAQASVTPIAAAAAPTPVATSDDDGWGTPESDTDDDEPETDAWGAPLDDAEPTSSQPRYEPPAAPAYEPPMYDPDAPEETQVHQAVEPEPVAPAPQPVAAEPEPPAYEPPAYDPEPEYDSAPEPVAPPAPVAAAPTAGGQPQALRIPAVHTSGIETLKQGDKDLELRLSDAGLDVLRHSTGVAIGRLDWNEITNVEVEQTKKGLRGRKVSQTLQVKTARGQATFELPGLTEEESTEHLEPMLTRLRESGMLGVATEE